MSEGPLLWALCGVLAVLFAYNQFLVFTRDVPPEYLNEQSVVDSTRKPGELAIHKLTKLDYSTGLRVGLAIRYDHYKLRNGNLRDVWELLVAGARRNPNLTVHVADLALTIALLNSQVHQVQRALARFGTVSELAVPLSLAFADVRLLAVVMACFTSQVTVHLHDGDLAPDNDRVTLLTKGCLLLLSRGDTVLSFADVVDTTLKSVQFENVYDASKDRGIAVRLTKRANHKAAVAVDFTQGNLVASVASCLKHLPPGHQLLADDRVVVVHDTSSCQGIMNGISKMLTAFVANAELHVVPGTKSDFMKCEPTVVSAGADVIKAMYYEPVGLGKLSMLHRRFSLSRARFSTLGAKPYPRLRLLYAHRSVTAGEYTNWSGLRASLQAYVVEELGHFNTCGPVLVTDFYEFRNFSKTVTAGVRGVGAVAQADEIKLVNLDASQSGDVAVRGYNIGKARTVMANVGETPVVPDSEGFYQLQVSARWGLDGCLYIAAR